MRAIRFVLMHVAGARAGEGDASTQGQPSKYAYCIAENEGASPWESYARSIGVDAPSAVTIHCGESPHNFHDMESDEPGPGASTSRLISVEEDCARFSGIPLMSAIPVNVKPG